ncbi:MAG: hypothetical protein WAP56_00420, partial [Acetivibrionales bacterium]
MIYLVVPRRLKNFILLLSSLFFYFCGEPGYLIVMVAACISGYLHGLWIDKEKGGRLAKISLISSVFFSIGPLLFFKYTNFAVRNFNLLLGTDIGLLNIALPIGISFYTFQVLSYTIDVYRGDVKAQRNFIDFATYVSLFPQLIAGPIVRYAVVESELSSRIHSSADMA